MVAPNNPFFARALVNRVWGNFMGRGLTEPVDDVRATNPASNEELFTALSKDFIANGFDVKRLIRTISRKGFRFVGDAGRTAFTKARRVRDQRHGSVCIGWRWWRSSQRSCARTGKI